MSALLAFQNELRIITRDREGYGYSYATLTNCVETSQTHLSRHKLAISQFPISHADRVGIITLLCHTASGEFIRCGCTFKLPKIQAANDAQNAGAIITYARRYAFCSILGLVAEEDTDAAD